MPAEKAVAPSGVAPEEVALIAEAPPPAATGVPIPLLLFASDEGATGVET